MTTVKLLLLCLAITLPTYAQNLSTPSDPHEFMEARAAFLEKHAQKFGFVEAKTSAALLHRLISQSWVNNAWENESRTTHQYSGELIIETLTESWDGDSWESSSRTSYNYSGGQLVSDTFELFENGAWTGNSRTLYTYSGGELVEALSQTFANGAWVNEDRTTLTYSNGQISSAVTQEWDGSTWVNADRFSVEQQGNDVVFANQEWDGSAWVNTSRSIFSDTTIEELFESFLALTSDNAEAGFSALLGFPDSIFQEWDGSQWVNSSRQTSVRDAEERPLSVQFDMWEETSWVPQSRYVITRSNQGRITKLEVESFDGTDWSTSLVETHTYNNAGLLAEIVTQFDFGEFGGLQNFSRYLFEWTGGAGTAVAEAALPESFLLQSIYPNPFNPQATVKYRLDRPSYARISIHDALGRQVGVLAEGVHAAGDHEIRFDAANRPSGTYLIRLETPSGEHTRTVTLVR